VADVLTFIGGGVAGTVITVFVNWMIRRRQDHMEILKIISAAAPYYNQIAMNAWNFSWYLTHGDSNYRLLMYYMCNILQIKTEVIRRFGDLQFDNLEAERIIDDFFRDICSVLDKTFDALERSRLTYLTEGSKPYHVFYEDLLKNKELDEKFRRWIKTEISSGDYNELERKCAWYAQLIMLEFNHIYRLWYRQEPPLKLRNDLKEYLQEHEKNYFDRIQGFKVEKVNVPSEEMNS